MTDGSYPNTLVNGVPVVTTPAEIDTTTTDQLRAALLHAIRSRYPMVVVDMTSTHFCDSAGLQTLIKANKRTRGQGGELRLVIPAAGAVPRVISLTGIDRFVPCFASLQDALAKTPCGTNSQPVSPGPDTGRSQI
jgi:anti-sigma B factor antagonist